MYFEGLKMIDQKIRVKVIRRATAQEMQKIRNPNGSFYYWTDEMDSIVGFEFTAVRVRDNSLVVKSGHHQYRIPVCVCETLTQD